MADLKVKQRQQVGISRAIVKIDEEKPALKAEGYMTRDSRVVEQEART